MRKLHINEEIWLYRIGRGHIVIKDPAGKKILTNQSDVSGVNWPELERGYWKGYFKGITPSMVKDWIIKNILKEKVKK